MVITQGQIKLVFIHSMPITGQDEQLITIEALKNLAQDFDITIFLVINIPAPTVKESSPSYSHLRSLGNISDYTDALCLVHKETVFDPLKMGDESVETITLSNYARNCRLFVGENTNRLLEEKDYRSRYLDSVG